jgi:multidrug efflux pump subunit AcrA (membrane-fusion protein)
MDKTFSIFKNLSLFKKIITIAISVAVVVWLISSFGSSKSPNYDVYTVKKGSISEQIIISGNANATANAIVYSPSTGIVEELFVKNGDSVKANQILMKVKSTAMELDKSNALAAYQAAIAALNTSKQTKISNQSSLESARKTVIDASVAQQQMTNRRNEGLSNPATGKPYTQDEIDSINSLTTSTKMPLRLQSKNI